MKRTRSQAELEQATRPASTEPTQQLSQLVHEREPPSGSCEQITNQARVQLLLDLDSKAAPKSKVRLQDGYTPFPQMLASWQDNQHDNTLYSVRLVGDSEQPESWTAIALDYLTCHSEWAAVRNATTLQTSGSVTVLPIYTAPEIVRKVIESLYSGFLELSCDVEQILLMADCLQIELVKNACIRYLQALQKFTLPAAQLRKLAMLWDQLHLPDNCRQSLQQLVRKPWDSEVMPEMRAAVTWLLQGGEAALPLCRDFLKDTARGALGEIQVLDLLLCCGLTMQDPRLASLFDVSRVSPQVFEHVQDAFLPDKLSGPCYELLAGVAARNNHSVAWSQFRSPDEEYALVDGVYRRQSHQPGWQTDELDIKLWHPVFTRAEMNIRREAGTANVRDDDASLHSIRICVKGPQFRSAHHAHVKAWVSRLILYSVAMRTPMIQLEFDSHDIEEGPRPGIVDVYYPPDSQLAQLIRDVETEGHDGEVLLGVHICKPRTS